MDLLSQLLALTPVTGHLDIRCHFGAPWLLDEPPAAPLVIRYHALLDGEAVLEDADGHTPMKAGDIVLFPAGGAHRLHDGGGAKPRPLRAAPGAALTVVTNGGRGAPAEVLCGRFVFAAPAERLLRDFLPRRLIVSAAEAAGRLGRVVALMREESLEQGPGSAALIGHLSAALFSLSLRTAASETEANAGQRSLLALASKPRLQPALTAMFDSPGRDWTLPALAALCHLSRATFVRQFLDATGRSPAELLNEIRMAQALRELAASQDSVAAIGEAAGYQSEAAFQRAFKRHVGVTPARWRAAQRAAALNQSLNPPPPPTAAPAHKPAQ
ncbi:AraC family transcriptional regulator [Paucibacter sp. R3-3]|uniref:AraC family transcriptional regulator n=1 Tax=Roseateles agri TaxID=3098619 RepID=A0ABU5DIK2_9BURK|nr:AraC family transcriptional regulator [Paucibacter sp. R3-3]MDY0745545.1 AraC family transcriptional regulator [Paucibacter sp. R3-3]